ncbi:WYL domain-containing protein [Rossellomorea aquimaris]|uniref:WYL domain-containing protein n=1 Tax=Rossellomorea aquimaris TaxID=189382 RepID=A0A5D4U8T9_9BACI|nr:WYL domain-containing protein [Rossellomorea aquimaris]TYS83409.1 WYL domain-containing protein [Rossellomorea aquimaris]
MEKILQKAYKNRTPVTIIYQSELEEFSKRTIFIIREESNYIIAYCYFRKQFRTFNIENILAAHPAGSCSSIRNISS